MKSAGLTSSLALLLFAAGAAAIPPDEETEHVVEAGETLNGIANRAKVPREAIIEANDLEPPYVIRIGQTLEIPRAGSAAAKSAAKANSPAPSGNSATYTVKAGDTLGGIALREKVPRILIAEANGLEPPYIVRVGQKLLIPRTRHHVVKAGETGFGIAYAYAVPWKSIAVANGLEPNAKIREGQTLLIPTVLDAPDPAPVAKSAAAAASRFAWPVNGDIRRGFIPRGGSDFHDGVDIIAPRGTAVRATAAGRVIFSGMDPKQFGNLVVIDHGDGWHSAYASLGRVTVKKDHRVSQGERVGLVGDTSITKHVELHFELRKNAKPVDPLKHLPKPQ